MTSEKLRVIVLGGCGFIGRHLVKYLVDNQLAIHIRVIDKKPPQMAYFSKVFMAVFDSKTVEFVSANLINSASCFNAMQSCDSDEFCDNLTWDIVFNCAGETRVSQSEAIYEEGCLKLSLNCANSAALLKVGRYVELSTGSLCSNEKTPQNEECPIEPWTLIGKFKARTEKSLKCVDNLNFVIFRLPLVYGIADKGGLTQRILIAAIYKHLKEPMRLLWNEKMKMNTIHVDDVCAALCQLSIDPRTLGQTINLVDDSDSTQGSITEILCDIFKIKSNYFGVTLSNLAKIDLSGVADEINDKHLGPWATLIQKDNVSNTPLTPFMHQEQLHYQHLYVCNKRMKMLGYQLRVPFIQKQHLEEIINDFVELSLFPKSLQV